ncbi:hypothetical protein [Benzoatithermus flavus]|uniref:Uncharacterized protein n=1 Tax=Benzoatithermus flavus TaxID=3108223 RepID=A0ABU8XNG4_9PROT
MSTPQSQYYENPVQANDYPSRSDFLLHQIHWREGAPVHDPPLAFYATVFIGFLVLMFIGSMAISGMAGFLF